MKRFDEVNSYFVGFYFQRRLYFNFLSDDWVVKFFYQCFVNPVLMIFTCFGVDETFEMRLITFLEYFSQVIVNVKILLHNFSIKGELNIFYHHLLGKTVL